MNIRIACVTIFSATFVAFGVQTALGVAIYVDFGQEQGAASGLVDGSAATWNVVTSLSEQDLFLYDASGQQSGINLTVTQAFSNTQIGGNWNVASIPWSVGAATNDNFHTGSGPSNPAEVTLSNLDPTKQYRVSLIASRASAGSRDCTFTVNGQVANVGGASGSDPFDSYTDGYVNKQLMTWSSLAPNAQNELTMLMTPTGSGDYGYLSAMRISEEQSLLIDLGISGRTTSGNWNNITSERSASGTEGPGHMIVGVVDAAGEETSVKVSILAPFYGFNNTGSGTTASGYPTSAVTDSLATGPGFLQATVQLEGLSPGEPYDVILFGSRADTGETREAAYTVGGVTKNLLNTDNTSNSVRFYDVLADAQGHIQIDTAIAQGGYSYLGVIEVVGSFASDPVGPSILVDFGDTGSTTGGYWNNLATGNSTGGTGLTGLTDMVDSLGNATRVDLTISDDFGGRNDVGVSSDDAGFPTTAQGDSLYVQPNNPARIVLEDLHPSAGYDLTFFGSRQSSGAPGTSLVLDVTINGETYSLDAYDNTDNAITFHDILPDSSGTLVIDFTSDTVGYLGAMSLTMLVPEPASAVLTVIALAGLLGFRRRRRRQA